MNTVTNLIAEDTSWNHEDVVLDYDAVIDAIEKDITNTKAALQRLSKTDDLDVLFM